MSWRHDGSLCLHLEEDASTVLGLENADFRRDAINESHDAAMSKWL